MKIDVLKIILEKIELGITTIYFTNQKEITFNRLDYEIINNEILHILDFTDIEDRFYYFDIETITYIKIEKYIKSTMQIFFEQKFIDFLIKDYPQIKNAHEKARFEVYPIFLETKIIIYCDSQTINFINETHSVIEKMQKISQYLIEYKTNNFNNYHIILRDIEIYRKNKNI